VPENEKLPPQEDDESPKDPFEDFIKRDLEMGSVLKEQKPKDLGDDKPLPFSPDFELNFEDDDDDEDDKSVSRPFGGFSSPFGNLPNTRTPPSSPFGYRFGSSSGSTFGNSGGSTGNSGSGIPPFRSFGGNPSSGSTPNPFGGTPRAFPPLKSFSPETRKKSAFSLLNLSNVFLTSVMIIGSILFLITVLSASNHLERQIAVRDGQIMELRAQIEQLQAQIETLENNQE
jgi:hypothetical protein